MAALNVSMTGQVRKSDSPSPYGYRFTAQLIQNEQRLQALPLPVHLSLLWVAEE